MQAINHYWQTLNVVSLSLAPVSLLFCLLVWFRRFLYRIHWLKSKSSDIPIIVVGNIYIGGNGKTPFVIELVKQLKRSGYQPAIVSRGYGAINEKEANMAWPRQVNERKNNHLFGDEPLLIQRATQCPVFIDPKRTRAVDAIIKETSCDVIVSDDGLQHYAMPRFIEINITDAKRLYGNTLCLPAGPLREPVKRLTSVDYIVYNISRLMGDHGTHTLAENAFTMDYEYLSLKPLVAPHSKHIKSMTLDDLKGKIVHSVAGIGDPNAFFLLLKNKGIKVIEHAFDDHYQYKKEDFLFTDSYPIIMTEKDAVKCHSFSLSNTWYLPINAKVDPTLWVKIVEQLKIF